MPFSALRNLATRKRLAFLVIVVLFLLLCARYVVSSAVLLGDEDKSCFIVDQGTSFSPLVFQLNREGRLKNPTLLYIYGRLTGKGSLIESGEYCMPTSIKPKQFFYMLNHGKVALHPLMIIDGWNSSQVCQQIKGARGLTDDIKNCSGKTMARAAGIKEKSIEGLLYPETYLYTRNYRASRVLLHAYQMMNKLMSQEWAERDKSVPYKNEYQALIVASMVQKESAEYQDQRQVASVIINRLNKRMYLGIDATVLYGLNKTRGLTRSDIAINTPYNTYMHHGLPPTPIAMPDKQAIDAALHPAHADYYYYVADQKGGHIFTKTLKEHKKMIEQIYGAKNGK